MRPEEESCRRGYSSQGGCHDLKCRQSIAHCSDLTHLLSNRHCLACGVTKPCLQPSEEWLQLRAPSGEELHDAILFYKEAVLGVRAASIYSVSI